MSLKRGPEERLKIKGGLIEAFQKVRARKYKGGAPAAEGRAGSSGEKLWKGKIEDGEDALRCNEGPKKF